jgi:hypothetical protein
MAWSVGHDKATLAGRKKPVGDMDGDALLAFCLQTVDRYRYALTGTESGGKEGLLRQAQHH